MKPFNAAMFFGMSQKILYKTQKYMHTHEWTAKEKAETLKLIAPLAPQGEIHDLSGMMSASQQTEICLSRN
jgi:hypothetical protein